MSEWKYQPLGQLTVLLKDGTHGSYSDCEDGIPLLSAKDIEKGHVQVPDNCRKISESAYRSIHATYELEEFDVLLTIVGTIGRAAIYPKINNKVTFQRSVAIIRTDRKKLSPLYCYQYINSFEFQQYLESYKNASAQGGVYLGALNKIPLFHPTSLAEQRKIARILSTVDAVIEKTEAAIAKYKAIKAGMMHDLFTRGIDLATSKLRPSYKESPELYKPSELGWVPKEWEVVRIGDSCTNFINGGTPSTKNEENWKGTIPWITGADFLDSFEIGVIRRFITQEAVSNSSTHVIKGGNLLLVTRTGVGKLSIAPFDIAISQDITGLILNDEMFSQSSHKSANSALQPGLL